MIQTVRLYSRLTPIFFGLLTIVTACGDSPDVQKKASDTACTTNDVVIGVQTTFLQILCGCQEENGTIYHVSQSLSCTVNGQANVTFAYLSKNVKQQIIPASAPEIPSSAVSDPQRPDQVAAHGFKLVNPGTYRFHDQFNPTLSGTITIQ